MRNAISLFLIFKLVAVVANLAKAEEANTNPATGIHAGVLGKSCQIPIPAPNIRFPPRHVTTEFSDEWTLSQFPTEAAANQRDSLAEIGRWGEGPCLDAVFADEKACFGNGLYLELADLEDPAHPVRLGRVQLPAAIRDIAVVGGLAYVAAAQSGLVIVDISNPSCPEILSILDLGGFAMGVACYGTAILVADYYEGLRIIDVKEPDSPFEITPYTAS